MRVCLIAEGAYPYIQGGVSSWINSLIEGMPEHEFVILSIMPSSSKKIEYKYSIPKNLVEIKTLFLADFLLEKDDNKISNKRLTKKEIKTLINYFDFNISVDWQYASSILTNKKKIGNSNEFIKSNVFWDIINNIYLSNFVDEGFNLFFWNMRSMIAPTVHIMQSDIPKADCYHSVSTGYAGLLGLVAKIKYQRPFILTEHGIYAREREEDIVQSDWIEAKYKHLWINFFYFISRGAYNEADVIISLFNRNREIQEYLGAKKDNTMVISNGVDTSLYNINKEEHDGYNICAVLRITPIKDIKSLIKAFKTVKSVIPEAVLYLIGSYEETPEYYQECLSLINWFELSDSIVITGQVNVLDYYPIMDVVVFTSISEGQPLVLLEAFAAEIPVVATDVGSCKELILGRDADSLGDGGIVTKPVQPAETAEALIFLYNNPEKRKEYGVNGKKRVNKYYTKDIFLNSYRKLYQTFENNCN